MPTLDEQTFIHDKYVNELLIGVFLPETRQRLLSIVDRTIAQDRIDGLILGGSTQSWRACSRDHRAQSKHR